MVSRESLLVAYVSMVSAWIVGFCLALLYHWNFPSLGLNLSDPLELFWLGMVMLSFCVFFFGRLQFFFFIAIGALQAGSATTPLMLLFFMRALVLAWFGMLGVLIGEMLYEDLDKKNKFDLLKKEAVALFFMGLLLVTVIGLFAGALEKAGHIMVDIAKKIRNREITFQTIVDIFKPEDQNSSAEQNVGT